jgi:sugar/nucleoside kinase (ribokinase family)
MKFDVITIGTATMDVFLESPAKTEGKCQCLELGAKMEISEPVFSTGGGATNAAVTFARQGFKAASLFKIGRDLAGEEVLREMKKEKVSALAVKDGKLKTDYSAILVANGGERTILNYRGASADLKESEIPFGSLNAKWAYVSPGNLPLETIKKIFSHFSKIGASIAFNPSRKYLDIGIKKLEPLFNMSEVVLLNREEASELTGIPYGKEKELFARLDKAVKGIAVMTEGQKGLVVSDGKTVYRAGIFKNKKVVDRTGAGDSFGSGFVAGLMRKNNIEYAIRLGLANAASVVEHFGAKEGIIMKSEFDNSPRWKKIK